MKTNAKVTSPYGPVDVQLRSCDECGAVTQEGLMVSWLKLSYIGISVKTMGDSPDDLDFCSLQCVKSALETMTGAV